jgi:hypothetical protein
VQGGQVAPEPLEQSLAVARSLLSLLLKLDDPPTDLPLSGGEGAVDGTHHCAAGLFEQFGNAG